jgi:ribosomal 50S subunit-recycling heat shock protein
VTDSRVRLDLALNRLCLTRSRTEAKVACEAGAVLLDGRPAKASAEVSPGQRITLRFVSRILEVRLLALPPKSISKKAARELYEIVREEGIPEA